MDKEQALNYFWNQFDVPAFEQNTVIDEKDFEEMSMEPYPRITYEVAVDNFCAEIMLTASLWDKNTTWKDITDLCHKVEATLGLGGQTIRYDNVLLWVKRGTPFARRMNDPDDSIRRIILNIEVEYISEV